MIIEHIPVLKGSCYSCRGLIPDVLCPLKNDVAIKMYILVHFYLLAVKTIAIHCGTDTHYNIKI